MSFAAVGIALSVVSTGLGAASAAGAFSPSINEPNTIADAQAMQAAQAANLPEMLAIQAAAQEGGTALNPGYTEAGSSDAYRNQIQQQIAEVQQQLKANPPSAPSHSSSNGANQLQQQLASLQQQLQSIPAGGTVYKDPNGNIVPASQAMANFAGSSTADIQGQIMQQLAQGQLSNAQKYDPQFIAQALAQEQQANPQGVAARGDLYNDIQQQINTPPFSPVANTMNQQITDQVNAGSGLTPEEQTALDAAVNGNAGAEAAATGQLTSGFQGQARDLRNAGSGATWLSSGETPADIQYRQEQQNLSDLSSFVNGQTPESQFSSLSGANAGPTPNTSTNYLPSYNTQAAEQGAQAGATQYGQQVQQQLQTANPWTSGLSAALSAAPVATNLYKTL